MNLIHRGGAVVLLALCAACLVSQVLVRPAVGLANNNDFPKVAGPFGLGPEDGTWESQRIFSDFVYRYTRADRYIYNRPVRSAEFLTSEYFLVKLARGLQLMFRPGPRFDIRWLGAVNGAFFLFAIGVWIYAIPAPWRLAAGLPLIVIWTDVAYVQYLNSFYMDTAALVFLVLAIAAGLHLIKNRNSRVFPALMTAAGILFATSKSQHALPGLVFVPVFAGFALRSRDRVARLTWMAGSVLLIVGASIVVGRTTADWRRVNVFNVVFARIAPESQDPLRALEDLGLGGNELAFVGLYAFLSNSPMHDPEWARAFGTRCNYGTVLGYYLRHPAVTVHLLYRNLPDSASNIRPYANLAVEDGFKPGSQATRFTYWTDLRGFLLRRAPLHIILLTMVSFAGALWLLLRSHADRAFGGLVLMIQTLAAAEYAVSILADGVETARHLFVFHAATEISILLFPLLVYKVCVRDGSTLIRP